MIKYKDIRYYKIWIRIITFLLVTTFPYQNVNLASGNIIINKKRCNKKYTLASQSLFKYFQKKGPKDITLNEVLHIWNRLSNIQYIIEENLDRKLTELQELVFQVENSVKADKNLLNTDGNILHEERDGENRIFYLDVKLVGSERKLIIKRIYFFKKGIVLSKEFREKVEIGNKANRSQYGMERGFWIFNITKTEGGLSDIIDYINNKISQLSPHKEEDGLIQNSWNEALADPNNAVIKIFGILAESGVKFSILKKLVDVLFGLGIDVNNPWTATYHISDIVGHMSEELLGEDISSYKEMCRSIDFADIKTAEALDKSVDINFDDRSASLTDLKKAYYELRDQQRKLILSHRPFQEIADEISSSSNKFVERILKRLLFIVWGELEIPLDAPAVLYFRDMKTFASDLDVFYWGPKIDEVNVRLTKLLFLLGFKRDLWSTILITNEVRQNKIDYDVYHYFFSGNFIDINSGTHSGFYRNHISQYADINSMWGEVYPYLCRQLSAWNGTMSTLPLRITDFKSLLFRGVTNLLFSLSTKFNISFDTDFQTFLSNLERYLEQEEVNILRKAIALANHARNITQIVTRRRWEKVDSNTMEKIGEVFAVQGVEDYAETIEEIGIELEKIRNKYFGDADYRTTKYLPLYTDDRSRVAWRKTANSYLDILDRSSSDFNKAYIKVMIGNFLSTIRAKAQTCKDLDEGLVLAIDTDIGNLSLFAQELFIALGQLQDALAKEGLDNVRIFIGNGKEIETQIKKYLDGKGDKKDFVISAVVKNKNIAEDNLFKGIKDRMQIMAVDDTNIENTDNDRLNYIPILSIIELSIKKAMGTAISEIRKEYSNLTNVGEILEQNGMFIIYLLPKTKPIPINELRERYKYESQVLTAA